VSDVAAGKQRGEPFNKVHFCGPQDFARLASKPASVATSRPA
jgi:hypothetical protein